MPAFMHIMWVKTELAYYDVFSISTERSEAIPYPYSSFTFQLFGSAKIRAHWHGLRGKLILLMTLYRNS